jgi:hypothetical protein
LGHGLDRQRCGGFCLRWSRADAHPGSGDARGGRAAPAYFSANEGYYSDPYCYRVAYASRHAADNPNGDASPYACRYAAGDPDGDASPYACRYAAGNPNGDALPYALFTHPDAPADDHSNEHADALADANAGSHAHTDLASDDL